MTLWMRMSSRLVAPIHSEDVPSSVAAVLTYCHATCGDRWRMFMTSQAYGAWETIKWWWAHTLSTSRGVFALAGPGIARGKRSERVNLVDVSATLPHLMGIQPPAQCEGRVVREALAGV